MPADVNLCYSMFGIIRTHKLNKYNQIIYNGKWGYTSNNCIF